LDIRSGAAVILATLVAEGTSEISGVGLVDRGYDGIDIKLAALGAKIQRVA
jgi:UDP-N-acetylglucosamine 1-carboxyvinyltransferase